MAIDIDTGRSVNKSRNPDKDTFDICVLGQAPKDVLGCRPVYGWVNAE